MSKEPEKNLVPVLVLTRRLPNPSEGGMHQTRASELLIGFASEPAGYIC